jgi:hypothetical protein
MATQLPNATADTASRVEATLSARVRVIRPLAAVLAVVLVLGGCDLLGGDGSGTSGREADGATLGAVGPPASPKAYRELLATVGTPVSTALAGIAEATSLTSLSSRVARAEQVAGQAAERLGQTVPPADLGAEHADLVQAFKRLHGDLGGLRDAVEGRELCAAAAVMVRLGRSDGLTAVRDAANDLTDKGRAQGYVFGLLAPLAAEEQNRRLPNGQLVRPGSRTGRGQLTVDNGGNWDAVVTLAVDKRPAVSVYVRSNAKHTVDGIRDGSYLVYYTTGTDWDAKARGFTRGCAFAQFDDSFEFATTRTATQVQWDKWTITLQPVSGGTARTSDVDPDEFPAV